MHFETTEACRTYVEGELDRAVRSRPGWQAVQTTDSPDALPDSLSWTIMPTTNRGVWPESWYTLEARFTTKEFVLWFGNHQVGVGGLHWILHPAVHVAFKDVSPRSDSVNIQFRLADFLEEVLRSLEMPRQMAMRFEMNTLSPT
jgi:hypothetical protein